MSNHLMFGHLLSPCKTFSLDLKLLLAQKVSQISEIIELFLRHKFSAVTNHKTCNLLK